MNLVADRYHWFYPSAPTLTFDIASYSFSGSRTLAYEYKVTGQTVVYKDIDETLASMPSITVYVNNVVRRNIGYRIYANYIQMIYIQPDYPYEGILLPNVGDVVRIIGSEASTSEDRFNHLSLRTVLIQGANPFDSAIQLEHNGFQGGFRLQHVKLSDPKFGQARYCDYGTGFDYAPDVGFEGIDSFSYALETAYGQRSDAGCISITVGSVDIAG
jgi:hypothetical protein